jgi:DNA-binding NarL/FixJ family response regulator
MNTPTSTPPDPFQNARSSWQRWVSIWHVVFYASLAIATGIALLTGAAAGKLPLLVGLSLLLGAWYWLIIIWGRPLPANQARVGVTFLQIRARQPGVHILVLTTYDTDADILPAIEAGATGYLLKDAPRDELFRAIRATARGETVLAPAVAARLLGRMRAPAAEKLSARELEVLGLVAGGASNGDIARALHSSEATVKSHLLHIFGKLGVADRTAAVTAAVQRGILRLG